MSLLKSAFRLLSFVIALCTALAAQAQDAAADKAGVLAFLEQIERDFANGDIDGAMRAFTDDAVIFAENDADIIGADAIRAAYTGMLTAFDVELAFDTQEVAILGDTAYEQGTFSIKLTDKTSGQIASDSVSRHIHILKRQPDGSWKTWRMMSNTPKLP